ncbi:MAG: hypothetical protein ACO3JF_09235 [Ilumatobacteraceae bacterium]
MFTPGSKFFIGLSGLALISAVLYTIFVNPSDIGAYALFGLLLSGGLVSGFSFYTRDGDAETEAEAVEAAAYSPAPSFWPLVFALGIAVVLLGVATNPIVFVLGLAVLVGAGVEWTIQSWAERASADSEFNSFVRHRAIGALDYPGLAAAGLGAIAFLFSRIMLAASKGGAAIIFIIVASAIIVYAFLVASKPALRGKSVAMVVTAGALLLAVAGVTTAITGERAQLAEYAEADHYSKEHRECGEEEGKHYDHEANNTVSLRSAVLATIFVEDGKVWAEMVGLKTKLDTITMPRSNATNVLFRNLDEEDRRLVVNLGTEMVAETGVMEKVATCTQLTGKNQEQVLTLNIPKPSSDEQKYSFTVPGAEGEIKVVVP